MKDKIQNSRVEPALVTYLTVHEMEAFTRQRVLLPTLRLGNRETLWGTQRRSFDPTNDVQFPHPRSTQDLVTGMDVTPSALRHRLILRFDVADDGYLSVVGGPRGSGLEIREAFLRQIAGHPVRDVEFLNLCRTPVLDADVIGAQEWSSGRWRSIRWLGIPELLRADQMLKECAQLLSKIP